jgi:hypothetical protein
MQSKSLIRYDIALKSDLVNQDCKNLKRAYVVMSFEIANGLGENTKREIEMSLDQLNVSSLIQYFEEQLRRMQEVLN